MLLLSSVLFGTFIIAARGPFAVAPAKALQFYRQKVFGSAAGGRAIAGLLGTIGITLLSARDVEGVFPGILVLMGMALVGTAVVLMSAPRPVTRFTLWFLEGFSAPALRAFGVMNIVIGVVWIYYSVVYFS